MSLLRDNTLYSHDTSLPEFYDVQKSLPEILTERINEELRRRGDRIFMIEAENDGESIFATRMRMLSEVLPLATSISRSLSRYGLKPGETVQLLMQRNTDYFIVVLGVWMAGGCVSCTDPTLRVERVRGHIESTGARLVFCSVDQLDRLTEVLEEDSTIVVVNSRVDGKPTRSDRIKTLEDFIDTFAKTERDEVPMESWDIEGVALIIWSSGTTGEPKGIPWTQRSVINALSHSYFVAEETDKTFITTVTMWHVYGVLVHVTNAFCHGTTVAFFSDVTDLSVDRLINACHKYQPITLSICFYHGLLLANAVMPDKPPNLDSVKLIIPIGGPLTDEIVHKLRQKFPLSRTLNGYGASEVGGIAMSYTYNNLGTLTRGMEVRIVDLGKDNDNTLGPNQIGEIAIKSEMQMTGYVNLKAPFTSDGFHRSGDLGYFDEKGVLYYKGRINTMISYRGRRVFPQELEKMVDQIPGVIDVGVFGVVEGGNSDLNEVVTAAVVRAKGGPKVSEEEILDFVRARVEWFKQIRGGVHFVEAIPRNSMGKVLGGELKEMCKTLKN